MAKKHPHSAERRDAERQETHHVLPARVMLAATEVDLICRIVDASVSGLRVIVDQPLEVGTQLLLVTLAKRYQLQVAWCQSEGQREFLCGLKLDAAAASCDLSTLIPGFRTADVG